MMAEPVQDNMFDDAANMSDRDCVGAWVPAQAAAYTGSGWDAVEAQKLRSPDAQVCFPGRQGRRHGWRKHRRRRGIGFSRPLCEGPRSIGGQSTAAARGLR